MKRGPRLLILAAVLLLVIGIAAAIVDPFATKTAASGTADNDAPTAVQTVQRRSLTAQQTLTGTLGYTGAWTVAVPAGTSAAELQQAEQQEASVRAEYITTRVSLASDEQLLATAEAEFQAARLGETSDCAGASAAVSAAPRADTVPAGSSVSAGGTSACASSVSAARAARDAVLPARLKVTADRAQLAAAQATLANAGRVLGAARSAAAAYGGSGTYTTLPIPGDVIHRGETLYSINGAATLLFYGATPAWRGLTAGVPPGLDVTELNANLHALGLQSSVGDSFTRSTEHAIKELQRERGLPDSGSLPLGSIAFGPGPERVTGVSSSVGQSVQPGPTMTLSSTNHDVSIQLDVSQQSRVHVGDRVMVTLPNNHVTPGVVASVGKVAAVASSDQSGGNATPGSTSIPVRVRLLHPNDAGTLDEAPVNVLITTATVHNALVVPVNALVALAGGGYALEEVTGKDTRRLVPVAPGLFDDQQGLVQVHGSGITAGQRIVVPAP